MKRIIVCGGRSYRDSTMIRRVLRPYAAQNPTLVHGDAEGADRIAASVAASLGFDVESHPANWKRHGHSAGPIRNAHMASLGADLCIAFPGGRGTADMVRRAALQGIPVRKVDWRNQP